MAQRTVPDWSREEAHYAAGLRMVVGLDEVGRGPIAGPVAAGAVVFDPTRRSPWMADLRDSKMLTAAARQRLEALIRAEALAVGVGAASAAEIDTIGIAPASRLAMIRALDALCLRPQHLLLDAFAIPEIDIPQTPIIGGDRLCVSIAAASIVAKVARDEWMLQFEELYPGYGFASHKGYAAPEHLRAVEALGPCPIHRLSFNPSRYLQRALPLDEPALAATR